jgi:hypothetical protein
MAEDRNDIDLIEFATEIEVEESCIMTGWIREIVIGKKDDDDHYVADVYFGGIGTIEEIPIVYNCEEELNDHPFSPHSREYVLVLNKGSKANPTANDLSIIGFADGVPRYCKKYLYIKAGASLWFHDDCAFQCFVWDLEANQYAEIEDGEGGLIEFPCDYENEALEKWKDQKERGPFGSNLYGSFKMCGQVSNPGDDIVPCEKNGLEDIDEDYYTFHPAWATGRSGGHSDPGWCWNTVYCPTAVSRVGTYDEEYNFTGKVYARIEHEEAGSNPITGKVQVFTHLNERVEEGDEGAGKFDYTYHTVDCGDPPTHFMRVNTNTPRFINTFKSAQISNTIIVQIIGVTIATMDRTDDCDGVITNDFYTDHAFVAQADVFPDGVADVDVATLTRNTPFEEAVTSAFKIAYDEIVVGHFYETDVSFWGFGTSIEILG